MQLTMPQGVGALLAIVALVLAIIFVAIGPLDLMTGALIALCAASRLC